MARRDSFKNSPKPIFQFVTKIAASIGSKLSVLQSIPLGDRSGSTLCSAINTQIVCAANLLELKMQTLLMVCQSQVPLEIAGLKIQLTLISRHRGIYNKVLAAHKDVDES